MKRILILILLIASYLCVNAQANKTLLPLTGGVNGIVHVSSEIVDSFEYKISGCGAPTRNVLAYMAVKKGSGEYVDTCGKQPYWYSPSDSTWFTVSGLPYNGDSNYYVGGDRLLHTFDTLTVVGNGYLSNDTLFITGGGIGQVVAGYGLLNVNDSTLKVDTSLIATQYDLTQIAFTDSSIDYAVINILNTPPVSPSSGDKYLVGTSPTGAWVAHANQIATWNGSAWVFTIATQGQLLSNQANDGIYKFNGSTWTATTIPLHQNGDNYGPNINVVMGNKKNKEVQFLTNNIIRGGFQNSGSLYLNVINNGTPSTDSLLTTSNGVIKRIVGSSYIRPADTAAMLSPYLRTNIAAATYVPLTRTVNGKALSSNITLGLASSDFANQGTTTTVLHGNAAGNPSFGSVVNADITNATIVASTKLSATGTPSATTFLRGDDTWATPAGGGGGSVFDSLTWISAKNYGILPTNSEATNTTNATTALAYLKTRGGGTLYFPYADSAYKVRIIIPAFNSADSIAHIRILGANPPAIVFGTQGAVTLPTKGVILKSASVTSGQSVIACTASSGSFSSVDLTVENLDIRTYNNPVISGIDARYAIQFFAKNIFVNTNRYNVQATIPTTTSSVGIITPLINNDGNLRLENVTITGYYIGISANEHIDATSLYVFSCWKAVQIEDANLGMHFGLLDLSNNHYNIFANGTARVKVDMATIEHSTLTDSVAWQNTVYDVNDSLTRLFGVMFDHPLNATFTKNGGSRFNCYDLDTSSFAVLTKDNIFYNGGGQTQFFRSVDNTTLNGFVWQTGTTNKFGLYPNIASVPSLGIFDYTNSLVRFRIDTTGRVNIGGNAGVNANSAMSIDASENINYANGLGYWDATNGRLGIGTTAPSSPIHVKGTTNTATQLLVENTSNGNGAAAVVNIKNDLGDAAQLGVYSSTHTTYGPLAARTAWLYSNASGGLAIMVDANAGISFNTGTGAPAAQRMVISSAGAVRMNTYGAGAATFDASGNITSVSDERVKNIQGYFRTGLNAIMNLKPIEFKYNGLSGNETNGTYVGFSAQNVKANIPYSTGQNADGYLTLQDRAVMAAMVNAIQEQQKEIEDLRQEIKHLKKK